MEVLTEGVKEAIMKNIRRRMTPQPVKIRADVELTCFAYDGILHIQARYQAPRQRPGLQVAETAPGGTGHRCGSQCPQNVGGSCRAASKVQASPEIQPPGLPEQNAAYSDFFLL